MLVFGTIVRLRRHSSFDRQKHSVKCYLSQGVKKAINFEVGKLKRRIKVLLEAENPSASQNKDQAEGGTGPQKVQGMSGCIL